MATSGTPRRHKEITESGGNLWKLVRGAEYRFCSFVPAKSDDGTPIANDEQILYQDHPTGNGVACRFRAGDFELLRACASPRAGHQGAAMSKVGVAITCGPSNRSRAWIPMSASTQTIGCGISISPPTLAAIEMRRRSSAGRLDPLTTGYDPLRKWSVHRSSQG